MSYQPGESGNKAGRPKGAINKATREVKTFLEKFLKSAKYRESAQARVMEGRAPHLEVLWHHYAYGKPKDIVKHEGEMPPFRVVLDDEGIGDDGI